MKFKMLKYKFILLLFVILFFSSNIYSQLPNQLWFDGGGTLGLGLTYTRQIPHNFEIGISFVIVDTLLTVNSHIELTRNFTFVNKNYFYFGLYSSIDPGICYKNSTLNSPWFKNQEKGIFYTLPLIIGLKISYPGDFYQRILRLGFTYHLAWSKSLGFSQFPFFQLSLGFGFNKLGECIRSLRKKPRSLDQYSNASPFYHELEKDFQYDKYSTDSLYGFNSLSPINVAVLRDTVIIFSGPKATVFYFAHLRCKCGGSVKFERRGSCCPQESKYGPIMDTILLDIYKIKCIKCRKRAIVYINMYDPGPKYAPKGYILKDK